MTTEVKITLLVAVGADLHSHLWEVVKNAEGDEVMSNDGQQIDRRYARDRDGS